MKIWSRAFTRTEKILLVALLVILLGLAYYQFVDKPIRKAITSAEAECESLQTEIDVLQAQVAYLAKMQAELDDLTGSGSLTRMESYNNSQAEITLLNDILADTDEYSISFSNVTRSDNQIRRSFTLKFKSPDYEAMRYVIDSLCASEMRCMVSNVKCSISQNASESGYTITSTVTATFYETMVGGAVDASLPASTK